MATIQKFEDLEIWQLARHICKKVYPLTLKEPIKKEFRLADQMKGSSGSIMDNIAEGFDRGSRLEFINSLGIARGESGEKKYSCIDASTITSSIRNYLMIFTAKLIN